MACITRSDLAIEAELLASLQHPNIIKLRGMAHLGAAGFSHGPRYVALLFLSPPRSSPSTDSALFWTARRSGYFLLIDRLFETLDQRLKRWRPPPRRKTWHPGMPRWLMTKVPSELVDDGEKKSMDERLSVGKPASCCPRASIRSLKHKTPLYADSSRNRCRPGLSASTRSYFSRLKTGQRRV